MLETLTHEHFAALNCRVFRLHSDGAEFDLDLLSVTPLGNQRPNARQSFSLIFRGPESPLLPQKIYRLSGEGFEAMDIFLVPVARDSSGTQYEAIFN